MEILRSDLAENGLDVKFSHQISLLSGYIFAEKCMI